MQKFLLALCLAASFGIVDARNPGGDGDTVPIIITSEEENDSPANRGGDIVPISGYVDNTGNFASLYFAQPCGLVQISFSNSSDGSYYSTMVNGSGSVIIPLALSSGTWTVTFTLGSGTVYIGEFTI